MKQNSLFYRLTFSAILLAFVSFTTAALAQSGFIFVSPQDKPASYSAGQLSVPSIADADADTAPAPQRARSRAPEPSTLVLFFSGVVGMVVHFARMSFRAAKRGLDFTLSLIAILLASPLIITIAALVKLTSKGPIIYRQERVGRNGKNFMMLKFRSMSVDAEKGTGAVWAKQSDPRVTPIGGFLRKTHLDELPQFFNVLKGEMSIVGPRPERPEIVKTLKETIADYEKRLEVLPGITGLAQVLNKYDESMADVRKKVKYDLLYIKKMCWLVEMRVMALTCVVMLTGKVATR